MLGFTDFLLPVARSAFGYAGFPYRANVAVTKECHSKCKNCAIWQTKKSSDELTLAEYQAIAKNYPHLRWLSLTGGEPTDRADLAQIVLAFQSLRPLYLVNFSTNGLNEKRVLAAAESIAAVGPRKLIVAVSIDGHESMHDEMRGVKGGFRRATSTLRSLIALESELRGKCVLKTFVSMTLFKENGSALEPLLDELRGIPGFSNDRFHLNLGHRSPHLYANSHLSFEQAPDAAIQFFLRRKKRRLSIQDTLERTYQRLAIQYSKTAVSPLPCAALRASFHLGETGNIYPCTIWDRPVGNVREHDYSISKILGLTGTKAARKDAENRNCPNCWSPCEAYQSIAMNPLRAVAGALRSGD